MLQEDRCKIIEFGGFCHDRFAPGTERDNDNDDAGTRRGDRPLVISFNFRNPAQMCDRSLADTEASYDIRKRVRLL